MIALFRCVAEAVAEHGFRGLAEMVPGGPFALAVAASAWKKYRERKKEAEVREEIKQLAQANFEEARKQAIEAVKAAVPETTPVEDRLNLELYLSQVPGTVRASLKRPNDATGTTVPSSFVLNSPDDLVKLLPARPPRFKPNDPVPGLAAWHLEKPLGVGGFGEVWLARHSSASSLCRAVKFCHGQQARDLIHESGLINRVMATGKHPNIVPLLDVSLQGETPWLMYEYVPGGDLADLIRRWQKSEREKRVQTALAALRQLCSAVGHFHRVTPAIVHRDLKPANVLFDQASKQLRITDFGIGGVTAKAALSEEARGGTTAGRLTSYMRGAHTPLYASPQQREGQAPDPRDDVHALGVIGYQILTGQLNQGAGPDFVDDLAEAGASAEFAGLLKRCVAQNAEKRPRDAAELAEALSRLTKPTPAVAPPSPVVSPASVTTVVTPPVAEQQETTEDEENDAAEVELWFVNVGESENRNWDDCRKYGFLAAGHGEQYSRPLKKLQPGDRLFAYMKSLGYVGYGEVTRTAVMARDFIPEGSTVSLLQLPLVEEGLGHHKDDEDLAEWVVGVRWIKTFDREEAKTFSGVFAGRLIVCRLRDAKTLRYLRKKFNITDV